MTFPVLFDQIYQVAVRHGYLSLSLVALIDGLGFPFTSEVLIVAFAVLVGNGEVALWPAILMVSAANTAGSVMVAALGRLGGDRIVSRWLPVGNPWRERLQDLIDRHGALALAIARLTSLLRIPTIALAGLMRMPLPLLALSLFLGTAVWLYGGFHLIQLLRPGWPSLFRWMQGRWVEVAALTLFVAAAVLLYRRHRSGPTRV